ncbi:hypothetical protein BTR23_14750 [Alkalihalophilus pseudofirmus]|nr:hypothetical protein BTR23_14750 [Alkalihalophilus pseudofirmus]
MFTDKKYQMNSIEINVSFISYVFGSAILTIPRTLAIEVGTPDGIFSIALNGLFLFLLVSLYIPLQRHFEGKTLTEYLKDGSISKWVVKIFSIILVCYFIIALAVVLRILALSVKMYLLPHTPTSIFMYMDYSRTIL